jgi:ribosomal protein L16/L10AE
MAIWNPRQVATKHIDRQSRSHQNRAYPETPVTMHPPPVRTRIWLTGVVAIPFKVVLASSHLFSITAEYLLRRVAQFQHAP